MTTVAELIVQESMARGNRYIFGIPGGGAGLSMVAAVHSAGGRFVLVNNEATAAMAASVYGQFIGAPGISFGIQGTGGGNLVAGVVACYLERGPVLAITDRYPDAVLGRVKQQDAHLAQLFAPVVKGSMTLRPDSARSTLGSAFALAWAERPGPVHLDFPADAASAEVTEPASVEPETLTAPPGETKAATEALASADRIVVIVGTDAVRAGAGPEIRSLVENCRAVALTTWRARGLFPEDHPRYGVMFYGNFVPDTGEMDFLTRADLVVLAGVDPVEVSQPWPVNLPILQVQTAPELDEACPSARVKLFGPLKPALGALAACDARPSGFSEPEISALRTGLLARFAPPANDPMPAQDILLSARRLLPRDGILVQETGVYNVLNEHVWTVYNAGTYVSTGGSRTMGAAIPWAIGTALARPGLPILACSGDGGFLMRLQELEVVARLGLKVIFLVFDDGQLGTIRAREAARGLVAPGLQFGPVDLAAAARALGLRAATVERLDEFEAAMEAALAADHATVIDAKLDPPSYTGLFSRMLGTAGRVEVMPAR